MKHLRSMISWQSLRLTLKALGQKDDTFRKEYFALIGQLMKDRGPTYTVKFIKDLNNKCKLFAIGQKVDFGTINGTWFKTSSKGNPKILPSLLNSLRDNPQCVLTITNTVVLWQLPVNVNLSTVVDKFSGTICKDYLQSFKTFCKFNLDRLNVKMNTGHSTSKAGPNGPVGTITAGLDALQLINSKVHEDLFYKCCDLVNFQDLKERYNSFKYWSTFKLNSFKRVLPETSSLVPAKLAFLEDKAGKTRIVYIISWWFQEILEPLHQELMNWLKKQPQDGTYDQGRTADIVKEWTKEGKPLWSYDLTAATDRWPKAHQKVCIETIAGCGWAEVWDELLGINPYSPIHKKYVKYEVGQPMGAYSSWASLAIAHHILLRQLAYELGLNEDLYVVLGDDVCIADQRLAHAYVNHLNTLGVTISIGKSVIHEKQITGSSAEFAKSIFFDGKELTPVSPILLKEVYDLRQWWKFIDIYKQLVRNGVPKILTNSSEAWLPTPISVIIDSLGKEKVKWLMVIFCEPGSKADLIDRSKKQEADSCPPVGFVKYENPWGKVSESAYLTAKAIIYQNMMNDLYLNGVFLLKDKSVMERKGSLLLNNLLDFPAHPFYSVINRVEEVSNKVLANTFRSSDHGLVILQLDAKYLIQLLDSNVTIKQWKDAKTRRSKFHSLLTIKAFKTSTSDKLAALLQQDEQWW